MRQVRAAAAVVGANALIFAPAIAGPKEDAANRRVMHDYARCVVKSHHDIAAEAIVADEDNKTIMRRYTSLISPDCMGQAAGGVAVTFGGDLFRYALADALVNADYRVESPRDFSDRLPLAHLVGPTEAEMAAKLARTKGRAAREQLQDRFSKDAAIAWLSRYGECVVRQDPADARLWLLTPPDAAEETSRINMLRPAFNACLHGTLKFNRVTMRGTVAMNYYRLAKATPVATARKAN